MSRLDTIAAVVSAMTTTMIVGRANSGTAMAMPAMIAS
jgi:hypothetical protein